MGLATRKDIEALEPQVRHFLMYGQLLIWLDGVSGNPANLVLKQLLASQQ